MNLHNQKKWSFLVIIVSCAYSQIPEVNFYEIFTPSINDLNLRISLITKFSWGKNSKIIDI
jgi:hypothetical protein